MGSVSRSKTIYLNVWFVWFWFLFFVLNVWGERLQKNTSCNFRGFILFCFPGPSPFFQSPSFIFVLFLSSLSKIFLFSFLHQPLLREHYFCFYFICLSVVFCFSECLFLYFKHFPNKPLSNLSCFIFGCLINMLFCFCFISCVHAIGFVMLSVCFGGLFCCFGCVSCLALILSKKTCFPCNSSVFV